jgi:hypothetical protein
VASASERLACEGHRDRVRFVALSQGGRALVTGDGVTTAVWDAGSGALLHRLGGVADGVRPLLFTADGRTLVTESGGEQVREKDGDGHDVQSQAPTRHVCWSVTPERLSLRRERRVAEHDDAAAYSADLRTMVTWRGRPYAGRLSAVHVRAACDDPVICELKNSSCMEGVVTNVPFFLSRAAAVSADGKLVAIADRDNGYHRGLQLTFGIWDARTGKPLRLAPSREPDRGGPILCVALSADGALLAAGRDDGVIERWETATGRALPPMEGHRGKVNALAFAPDGRSLASAGDDGTVRLWEMATGLERHRFRGRGQPAMTAVAFGAAGRIVVSGASDSTATLWEAWPATRCAAEWSEEEKDALWSDLGSPDAAKAFAAARLLSRRPEQAALLVRARLEAAAAAPREAKTVSWREKVGDKVEGLMVACGLRQEAAPPPSADRLRSLRAAEALEHSASAEARAVLEALEAVRASAGR